MDLACYRLLQNGVKMPVFGMGTSHNQGGIATDSLQFAFQHGVRLVDTASRYGTEGKVGSAVSTFVKTGKASRQDFFLTSKLWPSDAGAGGVQHAFERSCKELGVNKLDLYLVHWPGLGECKGDPNERRRQVWREMEALYKSGACRAIGVSNFLERHLQGILRTGCEIIPAVNQIEFNPLQHPAELLQYCQKKKIVVEGYCPFGKGVCLRHPQVRAVAKRTGMLTSQVLIRWSLIKGVVCIPKSNDPDHILQNLACVTPESASKYQLSPADVKLLDGLHEDLRVTWDPSHVP